MVQDYRPEYTALEILGLPTDFERQDPTFRSTVKRLGLKGVEYRWPWTVFSANLTSVTRFFDGFGLAGVIIE